MAFQFFKNSSNPVLKDSILENTSHLASLGATMTTQGAVRSSLLGGLLGDLELLHGANLVHGHVCPSNIAVENGRFIAVNNLPLYRIGELYIKFIKKNK